MPRTSAPTALKPRRSASSRSPVEAASTRAARSMPNGAGAPAINPPSSKTAAPAAPSANGSRPGSNDLPGWAAQVRLPLSWGLQTLMLILHAGEEWQRAQLDCWHLALKRHEHAHQRLLGCEDTAEMASVHADLLRFDSANLTQLAQRCMDAGVHLNTDLARLVAQTLDGSRHQLMRSGFESFQSGLRTGFRPLDEIFSAPILRELMTPRSTAAAQPGEAPKA